MQEGEAGVEATQQYLLSLISGAADTAVYHLSGKGNYTAEENGGIYTGPLLNRLKHDPSNVSKNYSIRHRYIHLQQKGFQHIRNSVH